MRPGCCVGQDIIAATSVGLKGCTTVWQGMDVLLGMGVCFMPVTPTRTGWWQPCVPLLHEQCWPVLLYPAGCVQPPCVLLRSGGQGGHDGSFPASLDSAWAGRSKGPAGERAVVDTMSHNCGCILEYAACVGSRLKGLLCGRAGAVKHPVYQC